MNLGAESIPEHHDAIDKLLRHFDALGGGEAEHPENDVVIVPCPDVRRHRSGLGATDHLVDGPERIGWVAHGLDANTG
jgi:hypothetical protein